MSKGKSKKKRNTLSEGKKQQRRLEMKKQRNKKLAKRLAVTAVCAAVIGGAVFGVVKLLQSDNISMHIKTSVKSDNYKVTPAMMSYYLKASYDSYIDFYGEEYISQYGPDTTKPLEDQIYEGTQTWYDYMLSYTEDYVKNLLIWAEAADADGFEFTDEQLADIQKRLNETDMSEYPEFVTKEDIEECMLIQEKVMLYDRQLQEKFENTDEEINEYFSENTNSYTVCSCAVFEIPYAAEEQDTELYLLEDEAEEYAQSLQKCTKLEDFQEWVCDFYEETDSFMTEEEIQAAAEDTYQQYVGYTEGSALSEWIYNEGAAAGEAEVFNDSNSNMITVCLLLSEPERDETNTIDVRHILLLNDSYDNGAEGAREAAEEVYSEWKNGEQTEEAFAELAKAYSQDNASEGGLYEDVYPGEMVTIFNDWCFDESRKSGDTEIITNDYGVHIMYFVEENDMPAWKLLVSDDLITQKYEDAAAEFEQKYEVTVREKNMRGIPLIQ